MTAPDTRPETRAEAVAWRYRWEGDLGWHYVTKWTSIPPVLRYPPAHPHKGIVGEVVPLYAQPTQPDAVEALSQWLDARCAKALEEHGVSAVTDAFCEVRNRLSASTTDEEKDGDG